WRSGFWLPGWRARGAGRGVAAQHAVSALPSRRKAARDLRPTLRSALDPDELLRFGIGGRPPDPAVVQPPHRGTDRPGSEKARHPGGRSAESADYPAGGRCIGISRQPPAPTSATGWVNPGGTYT